MTTNHNEIVSGAKNTDKEIWRKVEGDYYSSSIHVTKEGAIGINVGGTVFVMPVEKWHACVKREGEAREKDIMGGKTPYLLNNKTVEEMTRLAMEAIKEGRPCVYKLCYDKEKKTITGKPIKDYYDEEIAKKNAELNKLRKDREAYNNYGKVMFQKFLDKGDEVDELRKRIDNLPSVEELRETIWENCNNTPRMVEAGSKRDSQKQSAKGLTNERRIIR